MPTIMSILEGEFSYVPLKLEPVVTLRWTCTESPRLIKAALITPAVLRLWLQHPPSFTNNMIFLSWLYKKK